MAGSARLSKVFVVIGFQGQDESVCVVCISGKGVKPIHNPSAEGEGVVDPVFRIIVFIFAQNRCMP